MSQVINSCAITGVIVGQGRYDEPGEVEVHVGQGGAVTVKYDGKPAVTVLAHNPLAHVYEVLSGQLIEMGFQYRVPPIVFQSNDQYIVALPVRQVTETRGQPVELDRKIGVVPVGQGCEFCI